MKLYDYHAIWDFANEKLIPHGYEIHTIVGSLVDGFIAVSPDPERKYHFIAQEKYLNEWSSALTLRRCRRLPKWATDHIEREYENED